MGKRAWPLIRGCKNAWKSVGGVAKMGKQGLYTYSGLQECIEIRGRGGINGKAGPVAVAGMAVAVAGYGFGWAGLTGWLGWVRAGWAGWLGWAGWGGWLDWLGWLDCLGWAGWTG